MKYIKSFETKSNCREESGITIGLIDGIISIGRILKDRIDTDDKNILGALDDLRDDEDIKKILKFNEHKSQYDYDYIIDKVCKRYKWGNVISGQIEEFEKSDVEKPADDEDFITKFNKWLFDKYKSPPTFYKDTIPIKEPISYYSKST